MINFRNKEVISSSENYSEENEKEKRNFVDENSVTSSKTDLSNVKIDNQSNYRYLIFILFCLLNYFNSLQYVGISPITNSFMKNYNLNNYEANFISMVNSIAYMIMTPIASNMMDNISIRLGIFISSFLIISGSLLKILLNNHIIFLYLAQIFNSLGMPFITNSLAKISNIWFEEQKSSTVISIFWAFDIFGSISGFMIMTTFINENDEIEKYKENIKYLFIYLGIFTTIFCFPSMLFFRSKPTLYGNIIKSKNFQKNLTLLESLKNLFRNKNYLKMLIFYTGTSGFVNLFDTIINQSLTKYYITEWEISLIYSVSCLISMVSVIIVGILVDKYKNYKKTIIILILISILFQSCATFYPEFYDKYLFIALLFFFSLIFAFSIPIITCNYDLVSQLTFPIGESISCGMMSISSTIFGIILTVICDYLLENFPKKRYLCNLLGLFVISFSLIFILAIEEKLKRSDNQIKIFLINPKTNKILEEDFDYESKS